MSTFRGWSNDLIDRVTRAGSHYLNPDSLRWHGSFGGRERRYHDHMGRWVSSAVVESVGSSTWGIDRYWRVTLFAFLPGEDGGETVEIDQLVDHVTRYQANKALLERVSGLQGPINNRWVMR